MSQGFMKKAAIGSGKPPVTRPKHAAKQIWRSYPKHRVNTRFHGHDVGGRVA